MLVYEKKVLGRIFRIIGNGTVILRKTNEEIGYIEESVLTELLKGGYEGIELDKMVEINIKIPLNIKRKAQNFFNNLWKCDGEKPKSIKSVNNKNIINYKFLLNELEYEVIRRIVVSKQNVKTIAKKLGYNLSYLYLIKSKATKKIYEFNKKKKTGIFQ